MQTLLNIMLHLEIILSSLIKSNTKYINKITMIELF